MKVANDLFNTTMFYPQQQFETTNAYTQATKWSVANNVAEHLRDKNLGVIFI